MEAASNLEPGRCLLGFMFQLKRKIVVSYLKKNIFNEKRLKYIKHESRGQYHQKRERASEAAGLKFKVIQSKFSELSMTGLRRKRGRGGA